MWEAMTECAGGVCVVTVGVEVELNDLSDVDLVKPANPPVLSQSSIFHWPSA